VEAEPDEAVEDPVGGGFVRGPAKHVAAEHQGSDLQAGTAKRAHLHCKLPTLVGHIVRVMSAPRAASRSRARSSSSRDSACTTTVVRPAAIASWVAWM